MSRRRFLVVYDYGQGGIWEWIDAQSQMEISEKFPELEVFTEPPDWWKTEDLEMLDVENVDGPYEFLLAALLRERAT